MHPATTVASKPVQIHAAGVSINGDLSVPEATTGFARLRGVRDLEIVPGATHLFEEPGALNEVARLASEWFLNHLATRAGSHGTAM